MAKQYWHPRGECTPVLELIGQMEDRLANTDVFRRAACSPLYKARWKAAGIDPEDVCSYQTLKRVPFTTAADLRQVQLQCHPDELICSETAPRLWISTSGSTGVPKWIPLSAQDIDNETDISFRQLFASANPFSSEDVLFSVVAPAPFMSEAPTWLNIVNRLAGRLPEQIEIPERVIFSFEAGEEGMAMALKRRATAFAAFPSLVMRIAEGLTESAPRIAAQRLKEKFSLLNLVAFLVTRVRKIRARDIVKVHTGMFAGEPLAPYRQALNEAWGLKWMHNLYTFSEYRVLFFECEVFDGMHVWMDVSLPEIILKSELEREREDPAYVPSAKPLWEVQPGEEGELVITHFSDAFPLVRWRTSDQIRIASVGECACGRTHPRVHFIQRSDDLVNLGVIRFSTFSIKEKLDAITRPAGVARWQLRVSRAGYKPLLTVLVKPDRVVNEAEMTQGVLAAVNQVEALRTGWQRGLICEPVVKIDPTLGDRISSSGKLRPLVYESALEGGDS